MSDGDGRAARAPSDRLPAGKTVDSVNGQEGSAPGQGGSRWVTDSAVTDAALDMPPGA